LQPLLANQLQDAFFHALSCEESTRPISRESGQGKLFQDLQFLANIFTVLAQIRVIQPNDSDKEKLFSTKRYWRCSVDHRNYYITFGCILAQTSQ
jgi:hypothetical protein